MPCGCAKATLGYGIKQLYDDLSPDEKVQVNSIHPPDGKLDVVSSYQASIELLIELSKQKAEHFGIAFDNDLIEYIRRFMNVEMASYRDKFAQHLGKADRYWMV